MLLPEVQFIPVTCQSIARWGVHHQPRMGFCEESDPILGHQTAQLQKRHISRHGEGLHFSHGDRTPVR